MCCCQPLLEPARTNTNFEYAPLQLLQLDDEFGFLSDHNTTRVVDLCACPGIFALALVHSHGNRNTHIDFPEKQRKLEPSDRNEAKRT